MTYRERERERDYKYENEISYPLDIPQMPMAARAGPRINPEPRTPSVSPMWDGMQGSKKVNYHPLPGRGAH